MIQLINISKSYSQRTLYENSTLVLKPGERVGLVGSNGSGKTTLLQIIAGHIAPDAGEIAVSKGFRIGMLEQEFSLDTDQSALAMLKHSVFDNESDIEDLKKKISEETDPVKLARYMELYSDLEQKFELGGGYDLEHKCKKILGGLGFTEEMMNRPCNQFSGGQRMRISIAKLLLAPLDGILLDEPTNHLDLPALIWFESFLQAYPGLLVMVSHDQTLLNNVVNKIAEISNGKITTYDGNYERYCDMKERRLQNLKSAKIQQEKDRARTERFIERFRAKNTKAKQVQSKIKELEKEQEIRLPDDERHIDFDFVQPERSGYEVIKLEDISKRYGSLHVLDRFSLSIKRGEKIALTGKNGTGKSTLLKIMAGILEPDNGKVRLGANVQLGYFSQIHAEQLDINNSIMDEMEKLRGFRPPTEVRKLLGNFFFTGDDVFKKIGVLSGGEKSRVLLARLLLSPANLLLLDEPTNHLDIPTQSVLIEAIKNFSGTVCFVSHDRYLINHVTTRLYDFEEEGIAEYPGNYEEYQAWKAKQLDVNSQDTEDRAVCARKDQKRKEAEDRNYRYKYRKQYDEQIAQIEKQLEAKMDMQSAIETQLADPATYKDEQTAKGITEQYKLVKDEIEHLTAQWEKLSIEREQWL
ncbi:MAG: ABC-F family ATP-binding cassette domain-containing protein [Candidatus Auribacterota bacterium]|nr:ABC-F family ATP-binding cassette domain-containing protein [Candidatus Auribacterota bacterium]